MISRLVRFLLVVVSVATCVSVRAEGVIDYLPADALGFALVRDLHAVDGKAQKLVTLFENVLDETPPAPLAFIRAATGLGDGINQSGDALIAVLPGDASPLDPKPLLLVPVMDYANFAASVGGDASGEISRVTIAGNEVLAAKRGDYALLMNVEHRPTMERLLLAAPQPSPAVADLHEWLTTNDVTLVLLPSGIDLLTGAGKSVLDAQSAAMERQLSDPEFADTLRNMQMGFKVYQKILGFLDAEVSAAGAGVAIDDSLNIRLTNRIVFDSAGSLASMQDIPKLPYATLAGLPDEPFVVAGGGPLPQQLGDTMVRFSRSIMEQYPQMYGFENFDETKWAKVEQSWRKMMTTRAYTFALLVGDKEDPLYSNVFGIMKVDDTTDYLQQAKESMNLWNELTASSTSDIKLSYEMTDVELAGKPGVMMVADIAAAAGDDRVPMVRSMFEAMFGADGKMRMYWAPADAATVLWAIATEARAAQALQWVASGESGLATSTHIKQTEAMLNPAAPWTLYVSPQGCVAWFSRAFAMVFRATGAMPFAVPPYPAGPPVGFSMNLTSGQVQGEMAIPVQSLKDLSTYIGQVD